MTDLLPRLLAGQVPDPDSAGMLNVPLRAVEIGEGLAARAPALLAPLGLGNHLFLLMDGSTRAAMGAAVSAALAPHAKLTELILPGIPHPDMETVDQVRAAILAAGFVTGVVSIGSGTINDLGKHAAHLEGLPFAVFGTAPSMNGYTSVSAAITEHGHKKSLSSTAPRGVFLDLAVLAAAPSRLIAAGFGDSICRTTAQVDWLAAHLILGKPYREAPFLLLKADEAALVAGAAGLQKGDRPALAALARTLVMSGLGMTICGGSYPASQAEHLISHFIDMLGDPSWPMSYHGEHIAVTTLTAARLQEQIYSGLPLSLAPTPETEADLIAEFGAELGASCWASFKDKRLDAGAAAAANARLAAEGPAIMKRLKSVLRPSGEIAAALAAVQAPLTPEAIGVPPAFYRRAVEKCRLIRDRFTCLDMAAASGQLTSFVKAL